MHITILKGNSSSQQYLESYSKFKTRSLSSSRLSNVQRGGKKSTVSVFFFSLEVVVKVYNEYLFNVIEKNIFYQFFDGKRLADKNVLNSVGV